MDFLEVKLCSFDGCDRSHYAKGLCQVHRRQQLRGSKLAPIRAPRGRSGSGVEAGWRPDPSGYIRRPSGWGVWAYQHREVMESVIGRPLLPGENVHHRNGDKADNRPENLELWASFQPAGQRPADLVAWAREVLARYEHLETPT